MFTYRYVHTRHDLVTAEGIVLLIHLILVASVVALEHARGSASRSHLQLRVAETSPEYVQVQTMCKSWGSTPQCMLLSLVGLWPLVQSHDSQVIRFKVLVADKRENTWKAFWFATYVIARQPLFARPSCK